MSRLLDSKIKHGIEETSRMREELRQLMRADPFIQDIKNHFITRGVDRARVEIIVNQAFKDREEKEKCLAAAKKRRRISLAFLFLFLCGTTGWFYIWGDWITYFTGINFVLFLFFVQQAAALRGKAQIYE